MPDRCRFLRVWLCVLLLLACVLSAPAQESNPRDVDASSFGHPITLGPAWLFAPGDNTAWASPTFNDSGWKVVSVLKPLASYGYRGPRYGWYRVHVHLPPGARNLAIGLDRTQGGFALYANGVLIGSEGFFQRRAFFSKGNLAVFPVPEGIITREGDLLIALRFAFNTIVWKGGAISTPIGPGSRVFLLSSESTALEMGYVGTQLTADMWVLAGLSLLVGAVACVLYFSMRDHWEYLACAVLLLADCGLELTIIWGNLSFRDTTLVWISVTFMSIAIVALIEFVRLVLGTRRRRWLLALEITAALSVFAQPLAFLGDLSYYTGLVIYNLPLLVVLVLLPVLLLRGCFTGKHEAWVLLPAVLLRGLAQYWVVFIDAAHYLAPATSAMLRTPVVHMGIVPSGIDRVCEFVFSITILLFIVVRTVGIARRHAKVKAEMEAARAVQQLLIPHDVPTVPGFVLECIYKPAGEVGGDFFQILPAKGGGALAVVGDVSGKGMPAAMTVSLLLGTVRTLAHYTESPGEILTAMNQHLIARSEGGFTTCLVLRADADGALIIANAGHLPPYHNGEELPVPGGLPLGLLPEATYVELHSVMAPGDRLTFISDGVVEARNAKGNLLGFERMAELAAKGAAEIVEAAERWGQEDDITVLSLKYAPPIPLNA